MIWKVLILIWLVQTWAMYRMRRQHKRDFESFEETIDILSNPGELGAIKEGEAQLKRGEYITLEELQEATHDTQARR